MRVLDREWGKGGWATLETTQEDQQMREKRNNGINFVSMEFIAVPVQFEDLAINSQDMLRLLLVPLINSTQIIQVLQNWSFLPLPDIYYWIRRTFRSAQGDTEKERRTRPKDSTLLHRRLGLVSGVGLEVVVVVVARSECGRRSLEAIKQSNRSRITEFVSFQSRARIDFHWERSYTRRVGPTTRYTWAGKKSQITSSRIGYLTCLCIGLWWSRYTSHASVPMYLYRMIRVNWGESGENKSDPYCHSWNQRTQISTLQLNYFGSFSACRLLRKSGDSWFWAKFMGKS